MERDKHIQTTRSKTLINEKDIIFGIIILLIGLVIGEFINDLPLGAIFTAICVTILLILFNNKTFTEQPSIPLIITFLILPLYAIFDPNFHLQPIDLLFTVLGICIGFMLILASIGSVHSHDSILAMGGLFFIMNFFIYQIDNSGRMNLLIIWFFFALSAVLLYYVMKNIPIVPMGGSYTGKRGIAITSMFPEGKVSIDNEIWNAVALDDPIVKGQAIEVVDRGEGLSLIVKPID